MVLKGLVNFMKSVGLQLSVKANGRFQAKNI